MPYRRGHASTRTPFCKALLVATLSQLLVWPATSAWASDAGAPAPLSTIDALAEKGVSLRALYLNEAAGNVSGGNEQGATISHYGLVGVDVDLDRAFGWSGAAFHSSVIAIKSHGLNRQYIGGGIDAQENYTDIAFFRFASLTLEQTLSLRAKGDLHVQAGLMGAANYFGRSPYACEFMNHAFCGALWGLSQDTGTANAPLATWAARAQYQFSPLAYVQAGVFMSDKSLFDARTHLLDFNKNRFTGRNWLVEIGHETTLADDRKPHYIRLGGWSLNAPRDNVYYNSTGQSYAINGGSRAIEHHGTGAYLTAGKVIARPVSDSAANIAVFGSILRSFNSAEPVATTIKAGIVKTGTFAGREHDAVMFGISDTQYSNQLVRYLTEKRSIAGGTQSVHHHEYTLEVGYRAEVRPGVVLTPNIQYEINPTNRTFPNYPNNISNPLIIGVKLMVDLGQIARIARPAK